MALDQSRFLQLVEACTFRAEYWRGTIQDLSRNQIPMAFVGAPTWGKINGGWSVLKQNAVGQSTISGAVAAIVDVTGAFSVEWCGVVRMPRGGMDTLLTQTDGAGGFLFAWDSANTCFVLELYDNAGLLARSISTPGGSAVPLAFTHVIITSSAGGTVGTAQIKGEPVVATLAGAGVASNIGVPAIISAAGGGLGMISSLLVHASPVAWGREDQTAMYTESKILVGGEI